MCKNENRRAFMLKKILTTKKNKMFFFCAVIIVLFLFCVFLFLIFRNNANKNIVFSSPTATLDKIFEISEINTVEYTYNGVVVKKNDKNDKKDEYYIKYTGTITAGIDMKKIEREVDEDNKKIYITVPAVEIFDIDIENDNYEYIFKNEKLKNQTTYLSDIRELCKADLEKRINSDSEFLKIAKENAYNTVNALTEPLEKLDGFGYKIEVK